MDLIFLSISNIFQEKNQNNAKYGDFNGTVIWDDCNLEIKTSDSSRKHFLQGCHKGLGVLENIVVDLKGFFIFVY